MILHMCADHLHHLVNLLLLFGGASLFQDVEDERHFLRSELDPFLFALVMSAIITGASDLPLLPAVCFAASRISSSLTGSIPFIAG